MEAVNDAAYRKSVRNMSLVLAAIVITVFAAIFIPPYLFPSHNVFQKSVTLDSPIGVALHLEVNATSIPQGGSVLLTGWLNSTSSSLENITVASAWGVPRDSLWGPFCNPSWPLGVGLMKGHYTNDNYTLGTLLPLYSITLCPLQMGAPSYLIFEPHSSRVLFTVKGSPGTWDLVTSFTMSPQAVGSLQPGVYTAVFADEWGDVLTTNFQVV